MSGDETIGGNYAKGGVVHAPRDPSDDRVPIPATGCLHRHNDWTAEQVARALAWIKAHYGKPTFQCPERPDGEDSTD